MKRNFKKTPKVYVLSNDKKITYGSFSASNPEEFLGWDNLSPDQEIELIQYMQNMTVLKNHFGEHGLNEQTDFRLRLPESFIQSINDIYLIATRNQIEVNIYNSILQSVINQLKLVPHKLPEQDKLAVYSLLGKLGLYEQKMDFSDLIKIIFTELMDVFKKSEKLEATAKELFNKDKIITPKSIERMAIGEAKTTKWIISCAINILLQDKPNAVKKLLSLDQFFLLWAKPLLDNGFKQEQLLALAYKFDLRELEHVIINYNNTRH